MEPFIGQIVLFGGNFAPRGWALCTGQLLAISSHTALFSILGTTYGGDGRTSFALPDLRGRTPIGTGTGPGLTPRNLGEKGGVESVTLAQHQMPAHTHAVSSRLVGKAKLMVSQEDANTTDPANNAIAEPDSKNTYSQSPPDHTVSMHSDTIDTSGMRVEVDLGNSGGNQAHHNMPPFLGVNYIIALQGTYPSRN